MYSDVRWVTCAYLFEEFLSNGRVRVENVDWEFNKDGTCGIDCELGSGGKIIDVFSV